MYNDPQMRTEPTYECSIIVCAWCGEQIAPWDETREDMHIECWMACLDEEMGNKGEDEC